MTFPRFHFPWHFHLGYFCGANHCDTCFDSCTGWGKLVAKTVQGFGMTWNDQQESLSEQKWVEQKHMENRLCRDSPSAYHEDLWGSLDAAISRILLNCRPQAETASPNWTKRKRQWVDTVQKTRLWSHVFQAMYLPKQLFTEYSMIFNALMQQFHMQTRLSPTYVGCSVGVVCWLHNVNIYIVIHIQMWINVLFVYIGCN